jgi:putative transposase
VLILEYKLRVNQAQQSAIDEAIRTVQFIRNKCVRKWMDGRGVGDNDLQVYCAELAYNALVPRLRYRVYYLPKSKRLVSIEPLP